MLTVKYTTAFKRSYKLMKKRGLDLQLLDDVVGKPSRCEELEPKYHELKGRFKGFRECHIKPDWLLIYLVEDEILTLTLIDTGSHSDLFDI